MSQHLDMLKSRADSYSEESKVLNKEAQRYRFIAAGGGIVLMASQFDGAIWQGKLLILISITLYLFSLLYSYKSLTEQSLHDAGVAKRVVEHADELLQKSDQFLDKDSTLVDWADSVEPFVLNPAYDAIRCKRLSFVFLRQAAFASVAFMIFTLLWSL
jgi:predicted RNA-binding protein with EMAP domain